MATNPTIGPKEDTERIATWRAERAAAADAAKQERIKQAAFEKEMRIKSAADERKKQIEQEEKDRIAKATDLLPDVNQIETLRRKIGRERRWRRYLTSLQVLLFVLLPTACVAYYVTFVAVPMFEARAVVSIVKPGGQKDAGLPGVLGSVLPQGNMSDVYMAQEIIGSSEMMNQLDEDIGLSSYFGSNQMDPLQRLQDLPFLQISAETFYHRYVRTSVNIQTGLLTLYVLARTPVDAQAFSLAILQRAEERVRSLSKTLFEERIAESQAAVDRARSNLENARLAIIHLQIDSGYPDPRESVAEIYNAISVLEGENLSNQGEIDKIALSGYSESRQMAQLLETQKTLRARIEQQRDRLVSTGPGKSLNQILADYEFALVQKEIGEQTWSAALASLDSARAAAALGLSQFQIVVPPGTSAIPQSPNRAKISLLAFLVFFGLFGAFKVFRPRVD